MTEYEVFRAIIALETRVGEQGQYIVTGLFAFVMVVYLFGRRMTKSMLAVTCIIYTAYVLVNIAAVAAAMQRIVVLQRAFPSPLDVLVVPENSASFLSLFWLAAWTASIFFVYLVLNQLIETPTE